MSDVGFDRMRPDLVPELRAKIRPGTWMLMGGVCCISWEMGRGGFMKNRKDSGGFDIRMRDFPKIYRGSMKAAQEVKIRTCRDIQGWMMVDFKRSITVSRSLRCLLWFRATHTYDQLVHTNGKLPLISCCNWRDSGCSCMFEVSTSAHQPHQADGMSLVTVFI